MYGDEKQYSRSAFVVKQITERAESGAVAVHLLLVLATWLPRYPLTFLLMLNSQQPNKAR
jgi:hypothetical protein